MADIRAKIAAALASNDVDFVEEVMDEVRCTASMHHSSAMMSSRSGDGNESRDSPRSPPLSLFPPTLYEQAIDVDDNALEDLLMELEMRSSDLQAEVFA